MKRFLASMGIVALVFTAWPAEAQSQRDRRQPPPDYARPMPPPGKQANDRREERDRGQFERLSPEERRRLREDIGQHGREIYRERERGRERGGKR